MTTAHLPLHMSYAQMASAKAAIGLEAKGMSHSSGRSMRKAWALHMGMKATVKHDVLIAEIKRRMEGILLIKDRTSYKGIAIANGFDMRDNGDGTFRYICMRSAAGDWSKPLESEDLFDDEESAWKGCCTDQNLVPDEVQAVEPTESQ